MSGSSPRRSPPVRALAGLVALIALAACSGQKSPRDGQLVTGPPTAPFAAGADPRAAEVELRVVHALPDTAAVDVEVEGRCLARALRFGQSVGPFRLRVDGPADAAATDTTLARTPGGAVSGDAPLARTVAVVRAAEGAPCAGRALAAAPLVVPQRGSTSLAIVAAAGGAGVLAFADPTADAARTQPFLVVRHAALADSLDLALDGARVAVGIAPGAQALLAAGAGSHSVQALVAGFDLVLAGTAVTLRGGSVPVLYVSGRVGEVRFVRQEIEGN